MEEEKKQELMAKADKYVQTGNIESAMGLTQEEVKQSLRDKFEGEKTPDKREQKQLTKRVRKILNNYRNNALTEIDLENYKKYCELEQIKAESEKKLAELKRDKEWAEITYWLKKNKGNLEEIGYNTESKPSGFWYNINRGIWYMKKTFSNIPKLIWYLLGGAIGIAVIVLIVLGISKIV